MWTPADRALVGDYGSGQALTDDQWRMLQPLIPPARPAGRPRATDMRRLLDSVGSVARLGVATISDTLTRSAAPQFKFGPVGSKAGAGRYPA